MKLDKAIEINRDILKRGSMISDPDDTTAIKLGIEAIKRVRGYRPDMGGNDSELLPGETPDADSLQNLTQSRTKFLDKGGIP